MRLLVMISFLGALMLSGLNASATVAYRATVKSLTEQAQLIVHVRVKRRWSPKVRGAQGQIYTYTELTPLETWHGEVTAPLLLVQLGGKIDDLELKIQGDASLEVGQEVVLFLSVNPQKRPPVPTEESTVQDLQSSSSEPMWQVVHLISLAQSVFYVNSQDPAASLRQNVDGLVFYEAVSGSVKLRDSSHDQSHDHSHDQSSGEVAPVKPQVAQTWTLARLKTRVKQLSSTPTSSTSTEPRTEGAP